MKTNSPLVIAIIAFSIFASNAFGVLRPTYPSKPYPPDHILVIVEEPNDWVQTTLWGSK